MAFSLQLSAFRLLERARFSVRYPATAIEIGPQRVAAVRLRSERAGLRLAGYGLAPVQGTSGEGVASADGQDLKRALAAAIRSAGIRPGKATLLVPDSLARVWLLQFPEIPRGSQAVHDMIRWKIRKSVPFRIEEGSISWQVLARPSGKEPAVVLVGLIPRAPIVQYEALMGALGLKVGLVDLSTFNLYNAYRRTITNGGAHAKDFAVLNATESYFTLMLFRGAELIFYRCKSHAEGEGGSSAERVRTVRRELATSLSYYTEKLKGAALARTIARIADPALVDADENLQVLGFGAVERVDPSKIAALPDDLDEATAICLAPAMSAAAAGGRL